MLDKDDLNSKIEWEGGLWPAILDYGLTSDDFINAGYSEKAGKLIDALKSVAEELAELLEFEGLNEENESEEDED